MLKIAICDDQTQELNRIDILLNEYLVAENLTAEIKKYSHPDDLLSVIENESFHIYILDIVMPMVSGLELGNEIRCLDRESQIIYTTTEPQFALNAYAVNPLNYLIKPIDKMSFWDTLTLAISKTDLTEDQPFTVKTHDSLRVINLLDILCCEYRNHVVVFTLKNNEEIISRTIRESFTDYIAPILCNRHFLKCHNSFIVNMRMVERFSKDSFTLRGGKTIPIAKGQYITVRDAFMDYSMSKGD